MGADGVQRRRNALYYPGKKKENKFDEQELFHKIVIRIINQ